MVALAGCGDGERVSEADTAVPARGVSLVVGTSLERWGVLVVPHSGGAPQLRAVPDLTDSLWQGSAELPASSEARPLGGAVVLRTPDGEVFRYLPSGDVLERIGAVGPNAVWSGFGDSGLFVDPDSDLAVVISPADTTVFRLPRPPRWAAPLEGGGLVALLDDGGRLLVWRDDATQPAETAYPGIGPPGLVTAWGGQAVFAAPAADRLRIIDLGSLETVAEPKLEGPAISLAVSPSSHRIYAGIAEEPVLLAVDRFSGDSRRIDDFSAPVEALRPSLFGGSVLAFDGIRTWVVDAAGRSEPVPGEWRSDLPVAVGDELLTVVDGNLGLWSPGDPIRRPVDAPSDAWWVPVRWRPPTLRPTAVATGDTAGRVPGEAMAETGPPIAGEMLAGDPSPDRPQPGDSAVRPGTPAVEQSEDRPEEEPRPEISPGFYVIVSSSLNRGGISDLTRTLSEAGYPSRIQRHRDEAREMWYRALVGPYPNREAAETAARRLRTERGLQGWISEVGPDVLSREPGEGG